VRRFFLRLIVRLQFYQFRLNCAGTACGAWWRRQGS